MTECPIHITSEDELIRLALELGALSVGGPLSGDEAALVQRVGHAAIRERVDQRSSRLVVQSTRNEIIHGNDPLGMALCSLRAPVIRRQVGAVYTPRNIIEPMVEWVLRQSPDRVVDAGVGSGRFSIELAQRAPGLYLIAVDIDPLATLLARAGLACIGHRNVSVIQGDYTRLQLEPITGITAFVGNPPYVRHHQISSDLKTWAQKMAKVKGHTVSGLSGLHAYFYLATALHGKPNDIGCFVTSAEWLDVNYGSIIRELLLTELGGESIHFLDATAKPFQDADTTAAISCFRIGDRPKSVRLRLVKSVPELGNLDTGEPIARATY